MILRCFLEDSQGMYKVLKHTCWATVLPIRSFVLSRLRCRRRRDLLKVPINRALLSIEPGSQWLRASKILGGSFLSKVPLLKYATCRDALSSTSSTQIFVVRYALKKTVEQLYHSDTKNSS